jgi:hypothetical protein
LMGEGIVEFGDCTAFERAMDFGGTHAEAFGEVAVPPLAILPEVSFEEDGDVLWFEHGIYSLLLLFYIRKLRIDKVRVTFLVRSRFTIIGAIESPCSVRKFIIDNLHDLSKKLKYIRGFWE